MDFRKKVALPVNHPMKVKSYIKLIPVYSKVQTCKATFITGQVEKTAWLRAGWFPVMM